MRRKRCLSKTGRFDMERKRGTRKSAVLATQNWKRYESATFFFTYN